MVFGVSGFLVLFLYDLAALRSWRVLKHGTGLVGLGLLVYGFVRVAQTGQSLALPAGVQVAGGVLCGVFGLLLVFSLFVEIPLRETYASGRAPSALVTSGTYALCRHPGVLWFIGLLVGYALSTESSAALVAVPVWGGLDVGYAVLQDRVYFPRIFGPAYLRYQEDVPFLLPTKESFSRCLRTVGSDHQSGVGNGQCN